ncbi:uncharacterized protein BCR38DRAFT_441315 [Pseudomassariella vexata]|uniref:Uncharacterized protein n=1 Tax=Pseudomassariella vexata TaxID=1141098 RepID=A0A1Y2DMP1_9PEZI|nr:uncharacterized protein BCR38DRAFT_441315 [Pseudomassariella vexata]ORY60511.1 hypothetical protein BCR38DRAFT_441315 [Pseudomassariella vexata]
MGNLNFHSRHTTAKLPAENRPSCRTSVCPFPLDYPYDLLALIYVMNTLCQILNDRPKSLYRLCNVKNG